jgi:hypothetical protein
MRRYQAGLAGIKGENHDVHPGAQEVAPLTGSLAAAVTVFTVTACGVGGTAAPAQGAAPGQWTQAEVSQFTAATDADGSDSQDSCAIR